MRISTLEISIDEAHTYLGQFQNLISSTHAARCYRVRWHLVYSSAAHNLQTRKQSTAHGRPNFYGHAVPIAPSGTLFLARTPASYHDNVVKSQSHYWLKCDFTPLEPMMSSNIAHGVFHWA